ncbi:MAG TPA: AAA family ATPase [Anaerolineae bacterium]|nr:AAA family ATPase [Anaerolineae bacterium]
MRNLVPHFILERYIQGLRRGDFATIGLFVDISGFSAITDALMAHGQHGAEILVAVMRAVFDPLILSIYEQGGFVATLAGDAFTALFPLEMEEPQANQRNEIPLRALTAAWQIQQRMTTNALQTTPYGTFSVSAKVGVATGHVTWGVISSQGENQAAYYFRGSAVDGSAQAEHLAKAGEILMDSKTHRQVQQLVAAEPVGDHHRLLDIGATLPQPLPVVLPPADPDLLERFFPRDIVHQTQGGEFRQAVSLFVGLPAAYPESQIDAFMQSLFVLLARYGGLLNRLDFGDKGSYVLLFWGAPVAHENDIERALNFILDLQTQTVIPISAGITYHIAHAGFVGSTAIEEYTCYGRGTNLAARLMMAAPRGEIWLDEAVARRAQSRFELDFEGDMPFKGFAAPQKVYVLLERKETVDSFFQGEMIGRQAEMDALADFAAPLWKGQYAGNMVIWGEPGIGKSRLLHAFQGSDAANRSDVLWALCQTDEMLRESLNPIRYWLRHYFGITEAQSEARNKRNFSRKLDALIGAVRESDLVRELDRTRSFLGALVDLHWPDSLYEQIEKPEVRYENTFVGLITLLLAESLQQPVFILLEDAHWLDDDSRQFFQQLSRAVTSGKNRSSYPIALIATARREEVGPLLGEGMAFLEMNLEGLSRNDLARLADHLLNGPAAPALLDLLLARAEGNPFFAEQILRYLQEMSFLEQTIEGWTLMKQYIEPLPADVRTVLVARLDRLTQDVKNVIQTAAVLGREFEVQVLARMLKDDDDLPTKVSQAEKAAIWSALSELRYLFKHSLLQDAAYRMQVRARRQALHRLAVEALEYLYVDDLTPHYGELGYHAEQAGEPSQATSWYLQAAERAKAEGVMVEARAYYNRALAAVPPGDTHRRWRGLLGRIEVLGILGETETRRADMIALLELARTWDDGNLLAEAYYIQASHAHSLGDDRTAMEAFEAALAAARQSGNLRVETLVLGLKLTSEGRLGEIDAAAVTVSEALAKAEDLADERVLVRTLNNASNYFVAIGDHGQAADLLNRHVAINRRLGDRYGQAMGLLNLGHNYLLLGLYDSAREAAQQSLQLTESIGARRLGAYNRLHLCLAHTRLGEPSAAKQLLEAARPILHQVEDVFGQAVCCTYLGFALEAAGQPGSAVSAFDEARHSLDRTGATGYAADALAGLCRCVLAQNQFDQAKQHTQEVWSYLAQHGAGGLEFPILAYQTCAMAFEAAGDTVQYMEAVKAGYDELMDRAGRISAPDWRRSFLHNVAEHRAIIEMWERLTVDRSTK